MFFNYTFEQIGHCVRTYDDYKLYMINNSVIEQAIETFEETCERISDVLYYNTQYEHEYFGKICTKKHLAEMLKGMADINEHLLKTLYIPFCEFNAKFIDAEIGKSQVKLNSAEIEVIESMKRFPDQIISLCSLEQMPNPFQLKIIRIDEILEKSKYNFDEISPEFTVQAWNQIHFLEKNYIYKMKDAINEINLSFFSQLNVDVYFDPVNEWRKSTNDIKKAFFEYLQLRKIKAADSNEAKTALTEFKQLLLKTKVSPELTELLSKSQIEIKKYLKDAMVYLEHCELSLKYLIAFESTNVFSDINKLQKTLENRIVAFEKFITKVKQPGKKRIWLEKYADLLFLCFNLLKKMNVRALNFSLDISIPHLQSLLGNDSVPEHKPICNELNRMLNEYKDLYSVTTLITDERIRSFIEYDYENQLLKPWQQKIEEMKDNTQLDNLLIKTLKSFEDEEKKSDAIAEKLAHDYVDRISLSDGIRNALFFIDSFYLDESHKDSHLLRSQTIMTTKSTFGLYLNDAKRTFNNSWKANAEKHATDGKVAVKQFFDKLIGINLVNEINKILKTAQ